MLAAKEGNTEIVVALLDRGADANPSEVCKCDTMIIVYKHNT